MIKYILKQNKNSKSSAFGKWYAFPVVEETMNLADLAHHMEEHNSGFSEAMCLGVLKAMVKCIKEQLLAGKNVKIDDLAIFSVGIKNNEGAPTEEDFSASANISSVKLRARATGVLRNSNLNLDATLRKANMVVGGAGGTTPTGGGSTTTTKYTVTVTSANAAQGTVTGGGTYTNGSRITVKATPAAGYVFDKWSDGDANASRNITVNQNLNLTASFKASGSTSGGSTSTSGSDDDDEEIIHE